LGEEVFLSVFVKVWDLALFCNTAKEESASVATQHERIGYGHSLLVRFGATAATQTIPRRSLQSVFQDSKISRYGVKKIGEGISYAGQSNI